MGEAPREPTSGKLPRLAVVSTYRVPPIASRSGGNATAARSASRNESFRIAAILPAKIGVRLLEPLTQKISRKEACDSRGHFTKQSPGDDYRNPAMLVLQQRSGLGPSPHRGASCLHLQRMH